MSSFVIQPTISQTQMVHGFLGSYSISLEWQTEEQTDEGKRVERSQKASNLQDGLCQQNQLNFDIKNKYFNLLFPFSKRLFSSYHFANISELESEAGKTSITNILILLLFMKAKSFKKKKKKPRGEIQTRVRSFCL